MKYWVETLVPNVARSLKDLPPNFPAILVIEKLRRYPPLPSKSKLIYSGKYVDAYLVPPKPLAISSNS
ncbi:MAG: hypothetical protein J7L12_00885 [Desulfurococcales archaeon]|nr:hypothetical protein [Desulfurococcales archaeon]